MSVRGTISRLFIGVSVLILLLVSGSMVLSFVHDMLKEYARSSLGQATLSYHGVRAEASDPVELSTSVIRGDYTQVVLHQEVARAVFERRTAESTFPLVGIDAELTLDGFLLGIEPIFAPIRKPSFAREFALIFMRGEGVIERCFPAKLNECVQSIVGREHELKRIYAEKGALARGDPRIIVIVVGPIEHSA
jgi:hypothetical protein